MPHIPNSFGSTRGIPPELGVTPRSTGQRSQPPVPYHGSSSTDDLSDYAKGEANKNSFQKQAISPHKWDVDADSAFAFLFGKDTLEKTREDVERGHGE